MFIVVTVETQQLPVAAIVRVVVVVVVLVVDSEFAYPLSVEFPSAAAADVREQLERLLPVAPFALLLISAGLGHDTICPAAVGIGFFHGSVSILGRSAPGRSRRAVGFPYEPHRSGGFCLW